MPTGREGNAMNEIRFGRSGVTGWFDPATLGFRVVADGMVFRSDPAHPPHFVSGGNRCLFTSARHVEHVPFSSGVGEGVRSRYVGFSPDGADTGFAFETRIWVETATGDLRFEFLPVEEATGSPSQVAWPPPILQERTENGYAVLPIMQGLLLPDSEDREVRPVLSRRMFGREASMPWWGQVSGPSGYMAIVDTPWDAEYEFHHRPGGTTWIRILWIGSLGRVRYRRTMTLRLFSRCDYVTFCKAYRQRVAEREGLVTLKEKIARNPKVAGLVGSPVLHTPSAQWHCEPESLYFNAENPSANEGVHPFSAIAASIEAIHALGVRGAYVHIDGWGKRGYDNEHPDILPPSAAAGGPDGFRDLLARIRAVGYLPAVHDQFRDYYFKAESYAEDQAVRLADGTLDTCAIWPGGWQAFLCAQLAPDYVRRNYRWLAREGMLPDGAYLDVFSVVELDECAHPDHIMSRKECMEKRIECFELIRSMGMVVSSEEPIDHFVAHLDLVHHGPYAYAIWESVHAEPFGIPVPLFNLVYHDCLLMPWSLGMGGWGFPKDEPVMLHALLNGGMPYLSMTPDPEELEKVSVVLRLHGVVALSDMVRHRFPDGAWTRQETEFSCGTRVRVDLEAGTYEIAWPDGTSSCGSALREPVTIDGLQAV